MFKKICLYLFTSCLLIIPLITLAVAADPPTFEYESNQIQTTTGLGSQDPVIVATYIINIFLGLLGIVALLILIYAGLIWMKARGNEEEVTKAKGTLQAALIGLIIILASYGISAYVYNKLIEISSV